VADPEESEAPETEPEEPEERERSRFDRRRVFAAIGRWHSAAWWTGVGGIVGVVGLVVTVVGSCDPSEPARAGSPFTVTVGINQDGCSGATAHHVVPEAGAALVRPYHNVMLDPAVKGAADAGFTDVVVTLQGTSAVAAVVHGMRVTVASRGTPAGAAYRDNAAQCGGIQPAYFGVDLDRDGPTTKVLPGDDGATRPFPFRISDSDPEVLHVYGVTRRCDCRWYVELQWSSAGESGTTKVTDDGEPFRTVGVEGIPVLWNGDGKGWVADPFPPKSRLD
jgi:hypothetical protein